MADLGLAAKVRPVLVLSVAYEGQERAIVSYVIRTTSLRATQYEVPHETRGESGIGSRLYKTQMPIKEMGFFCFTKHICIVFLS